MRKANLLEVYNLLLSRFGPQHWWPGDTSFEVVVGAILTQSTSWKNVEKAIRKLKDAGALSPEKLHEMKEKDLAVLIKSAGYFNAKTRKLKAFMDHLHMYHGGCLEKMLSAETDVLRSELLSIWGVGPETADSIILYAAEKPVFVVDAYTKRIFSRLGYVNEDINYEGLRSFSEKNLPLDVKVYNELHALLVALGKDYCKKTKPLCSGCPLMKKCLYARKNSHSKKKQLKKTP